MADQVRVTFQFAVGQRVRWAGDGDDDFAYVIVWRRWTEGLLRFVDYGLGVDMLPAVNGEDSGAPVQPPHSCFAVLAHEVTRLVFATYAPFGAFTLTKQPPNPVGLMCTPQA